MARKKKRQNRLLKHLKSLGFTNRLCLYALCFLLISIVLGFVLAVMSIRSEANFTLAAYTCSVAPIGTFISIAIGKAVEPDCPSLLRRQEGSCRMMMTGRGTSRRFRLDIVVISSYNYNQNITGGDNHDKSYR